MQAIAQKSRQKKSNIDLCSNYVVPAFVKERERNADKSFKGIERRNGQWEIISICKEL